MKQEAVKLHMQTHKRNKVIFLHRKLTLSREVIHVYSLSFTYAVHFDKAVKSQCRCVYEEVRYVES